MSNNPFAQPSAGGGQFTPAEHIGKLLLVYPKSYEANFETKHGTSDAVSCDIVIVDDNAAILDAMIFGNLARSVRGSVGDVVLGRLGQGANTKGNPPWQLNSFTQEEGDRAVPLHAAYKSGQFKTASSAGAPIDDPWATTPTAQPASAWAPPAPAPAAAPQPAGNVTSVDPNLVAYLATKGVQVTPEMTQQTAEMIAKTFG